MTENGENETQQTPPGPLSSESSKTADIFKRLAAPFPEDDLEWRIDRAGLKTDTTPYEPWAIVVPYIQNRAIMARLDQVVGPDHWFNQFDQFDNGIVCGISLLIPGCGLYNERTLEIRQGAEARWVTKFDGAPETKIESFKGGLSDAMKRAAVQWGIGRYLYSLPQPQWAVISENGINYANPEVKMPDGSKQRYPFRWDPPQLEEGAVSKADLDAACSVAFAGWAKSCRTQEELDAMTVKNLDLLQKLSAPAKVFVREAIQSTKDTLKGTQENVSQ